MPVRGMPTPFASSNPYLGWKKFVSNLNSMMHPSRIGIASSVSLDKGAFDPLVALDYAVRNGFSPVQLYLDLRIVESRPAREEIRARAREHRLPIMLHAPGLLRLPEVGNEPTIRAALDLLA